MSAKRSAADEVGSPGRGQSSRARRAAARGEATRVEPPMIEALGQSEAFLDFQQRLPRLARVDRPVLIVGERGTGKELAATRLHHLSDRWDRPLVALNCAALAPSLVESELFGHEAGAFTGAAGRRRGRFEVADGGSLFLDEIASIPVEVQEKILRVVEYGVFERVGGPLAGEGPVTVDVRIIGATNADLSQLAETGSFKRDLLDRLSFEVLFLPPLREREGDVMLLANHFAARMAHELGRLEEGAIPQFTERARAALEGHPWPGNIRELKNVVERAVYRSDSAVIGAQGDEIVFDPFRDPLPRPQEEATPATRPRGDKDDTTKGFHRQGRQERRERRGRGADEADKVDKVDKAEEVCQVHKADEAVYDSPAPPEGVGFAEAVRDVEVRLLRRALAECRYNQHKAAELLGLTYHQFRGLYRKYAQDLRKPVRKLVRKAARKAERRRSSPPRSPEDERKDFLDLADAFIAQAERCDVGIDDALSEVRLRARIRRKKAEAEELERVVHGEMEAKAKRAEEERRREKAARKGKK